MTEGGKKDIFPYIGTDLGDDYTRIEGPLSPEALKKRQLEIIKGEKLPVTTTTAKSKGEAILKIIGSLLANEKRQKPGSSRGDR
jgi:hypothetical protein